VKRLRLDEVVEIVVGSGHDSVSRRRGKHPLEIAKFQEFLQLFQYRSNPTGPYRKGQKPLSMSRRSSSTWSKVAPPKSLDPPGRNSPTFDKSVQNYTPRWRCCSDIEIGGTIRIARPGWLPSAFEVQPTP